MLTVIIASGEAGNNTITADSQLLIKTEYNGIEAIEFLTEGYFLY